MNKYIKLTGVGLMLYLAIIIKETPVAYAAIITDCSTALDQENETYELSANTSNNCVIAANNITLDGKGFELNGYIQTMSNSFEVKNITINSSYYSVYATGIGADAIFTDVNMSGYTYGIFGDISISGSTINGNLHENRSLISQGGINIVDSVVKLFKVSGDGVNITNSTVGNGYEESPSYGYTYNSSVLANEISINDSTINAYIRNDYYTNGTWLADTILITNSAVVGGLRAKITEINDSSVSGYISIRSGDYYSSDGSLKIIGSTITGLKVGGLIESVNTPLIITNSTVSFVGGYGIWATNNNNIYLTDSLVSAKISNDIDNVHILNTPPSLTVTPLSLEIDEDEVFNPQTGTVTAFDQIGPDLVDVSDNIQVTGTVEVTPGEYELIYSIEDQPLIYTVKGEEVIVGPNTSTTTRTITRLSGGSNNNEEPQPSEEPSRRSSSRRQVPQSLSSNTQLTQIITQYAQFLKTLLSIGIELPKQVTDILNTIPNTTTPNTTTTTFTRDLTLGSTGEDVSTLQQLLISKGYSIPQGATGYFGTQTQQAVAQYQRDNGIEPAEGWFGPVTRDVVNSF